MKGREKAARSTLGWGPSVARGWRRWDRIGLGWTGSKLVVRNENKKRGQGSKDSECHTVLGTGARDWSVGQLVCLVLRSAAVDLIACFFATSPSAGGPGGLGATVYCCAVPVDLLDGLQEYGRLTT